MGHRECNVNCFEVLDIIQSHDEFADIPVVAYSVHIAQANEARRKGFHSFLSKPIKQDQFDDQLLRILSGKPVWDI